MSVTEWFGKQDLGLKYAIVLGSLIFLTVLFATIKLLCMKRRISKAEKEAKVQSKDESQNLNQRQEEEGDLFGIRALEKGFFGGVAQSRPATPVSYGSYGSSTLAPPRSAHIPSRPSSELGHPKPVHLTPGVAMGPISRSTGSGSTPPTPTIAIHPDRTRSPSPTDSQTSQARTSRSSIPTIMLYSDSPISNRTSLNSIETSSSSGNQQSSTSAGKQPAQI